MTNRPEIEKLMRLFMYLPIVSPLCLSLVKFHDIRIKIDDFTRILVREVLGLHKNVATFSLGQKKY